MRAFIANNVGQRAGQFRTLNALTSLSFSGRRVDAIHIFLSSSSFSGSWVCERAEVHGMKEVHPTSVPLMAAVPAGPSELGR